MNKFDVVDVTIRMVGDNAKAGANAPSGTDVAAPETSGNPSGAPTGGTPVTIPSVGGLPVGPGGSGSGKDQPMCPKPADTNSWIAVNPGQSAGFPPASDQSSAGGIKTTTTWVQKTGSVQKFPSASDTTSAGGIKMAESFMPDGSGK